MDFISFDYIKQFIPQILKGVPYTLELTFASVAAGLVIGVMIALIRINKIIILNRLSIFYISFFRGTPLLVQILLFYYGIPLFTRYLNYKFSTGIDITSISAFYFVFVSLSLNISSYFAETVRAAILAVPSGQLDACYSIGMTSAQAYRRVILPQAFVNALPNLTNSIIDVLKGSSLAFVVTIPEIMGRAKIVAGSTSYFFEAYIVAAGIYWILCIGLEIILKYVEKRITIHYKNYSL